MLFFLPAFILTAVTLCTYAEDLSKPKPSPTPFQDWDYIVYSQRWPITGCAQWKERNSKNSCNMPQDNTTWTVHGVWPSKIGKQGPFFCDSAIHFDPDQLQPMMKELQEYWPNIEANTKPNSFWKHEWSKHGTCASTLPQLDSVTNYFKQGLQWNQEYRVSTILAKNNIVPDSQGYNISNIYKSVKAAIGKNPSIQCVVDGKSKESWISQVEICFNKDLELIDCDVTNSTSFEDEILTNCNRKKDVMYFASIQNKNSVVFEDDMELGEHELNTDTCIENFYLERELLKVYGLIKFLMWFTL